MGEVESNECLYILPLQQFHLTLPTPQWEEAGIASYYADSFVGKQTASGSKMDQRKLECAHISLPLGSKVEVYNPANQRKVVLTISDRMPKKHRGRILDLTRKAMKDLVGPSYTKKGLITVKVRILDAN